MRKANLTNSERIRQFLEANPNVSFTTHELAKATGISIATFGNINRIKDLNLLSTSKMIGGHHVRFWRVAAGDVRPVEQEEPADPRDAQIIELKAKVQQQADAVDQEKEHLRARANTLANQVRDYAREAGKYEAYAKLIREAVKAEEPLPLVAWAPPKNGPRTPVIPVLKFGDWHIGEVISKAETEGFGEYNYSIAADRIEQITDAFLRWVKTQRNGYKIEECVISCEGDFISGDIHRELEVTNEFPTPVQATKAGLLLAHAVAKIAQQFAKVTLLEVGADNHSRLTRKPQAKQKSTNSLSHVVYEIADSYLREHEHVTPVRAPGMKLEYDINGYRFLIHHGDTIKAFMGTPYYSMDRERAREMQKRVRTGGFHYESIAHWHQFAWIGGCTIVGGSLCGTTEYDHSQGRHAPPAQLAFMVGKYGAFNLVPFQPKL